MAESTVFQPLRIVVKIGTSTVTRPNGSHNLRSMDVLARVLSDLKGLGHEVILVSSGAIGMGAGKLGMAERPRELRMKQAAAAVGQCEMMHIYDKFFGEYGQTVAQILLTEEDVEDPIRTDHLISTFSALLSLGAVPIVNENDSVSSSEIERGKSRVLGDNDTLSAIVADLVDADLLVLLSDIDGLYDSDPRKNPDAKLISRVTEITPALREAAGGAGTQWGTGGMSTKLDAAQLAMGHGTDMVITNGRNIEALYDIVEGKPVGTRFVARAD
jgi:glutamate 5-kinase